MVVDIAAGVPEVGFWSFYATAITGTFASNIYDSDGQTIGTYAASALAAATNYSVSGATPRAGGSADASLFGVVTWGSSQAGGPNKSNGLWSWANAAFVQIPEAIAATLRFTTGYQAGLVATATSPFITDALAGIGRGNIGSDGGGGGGGGPTANVDLVGINGVAPGATNPLYAVFPPRGVNQETDATYNYYAFAQPGTALPGSTWQVFRRNQTTGYLQYADGNANYDNVGSGLAALTYL